MNEPLSFEEAPEPTNIIWENRHISYWNQFIRQIIVIIIIGVILLLAVVIFFFLKKIAIANQEKYPPSRDCVSISALFKDKPSDYKKYADIDMDDTLSKKGTGVY